MAVTKIMIIVAFASAVSSSEIDEVELNKRGVDKTTSVNTIPSGGQKQDYTYSIYSQSPSTQNSASQTYQNQVPNSFYPNQASSQYYSSGSSSSDTSYSPQPQTSSSQNSSPFVPLSFVPNPGYQSKYQIVSKPHGNIQLSVVHPHNYPQSVIYPQIPQTYFTQNPQNQIHSQQVPYNSVPQLGVGPHYQQLSLGGSYIGHPSSMMLFAPPNPSLYNNLVYPNPVQGFYNNYPNSQAKYSVPYPSPAQTGYDKVQGTYTQSSSKEDNEIASHSPDYSEQSDTNSSYKNSYSGRNSYAKI